MSNETLFSGKADSYAKGRPGYAPEAIDLIFERLLRAGHTVADIGSGTGILSGEFLRRGFDTYCIEPNDDMRRRAEAVYGMDSHFHSVPAPAEHTGLPGKSMDFITAASSFHWFDPEAFQAECRRILAPGGTVCLLFNVRDYHDAFTVRQHEICMRYCPGFVSLRHGLEEAEPNIRKFFGNTRQRAEFLYPLEYTKEGFISRSLSSSYAPRRGDAGYEPYKSQLSRLIDEMGAGGNVVVANATVIFWGTFS